MKIDLKNLREMHPQLPADIAVTILVRAALALQRNGHQTGARLSLQAERSISQGSLSWTHADIATIELHYDNPNYRGRCGGGDARSDA